MTSIDQIGRLEVLLPDSRIVFALLDNICVYKKGIAEIVNRKR